MAPGAGGSHSSTCPRPRRSRLPRFPASAPTGPLRQPAPASRRRCCRWHRGVPSASTWPSCASRSWVASLHDGLPDAALPARDDRDPEGAGGEPGERQVAVRRASGAPLVAPGLLVLIAVGVMLLLDRIGLPPPWRPVVAARADRDRRCGALEPSAERRWTSTTMWGRSRPVVSATSPTVLPAGATATATATSPVHGFGDDLDEHRSARWNETLLFSAYERRRPHRLIPPCASTVPRRPWRSFYARSGLRVLHAHGRRGCTGRTCGGHRPVRDPCASCALLWLGPVLGAFLGRPRLSLLGGCSPRSSWSPPRQIDVRVGSANSSVTPLSRRRRAVPPSRLGSMQLDLSNAALSRTTTVKGR